MPNHFSLLSHHQHHETPISHSHEITVNSPPLCISSCSTQHPDDIQEMVDIQDMSSMLCGDALDIAEKDIKITS